MTWDRGEGSEVMGGVEQHGRDVGGPQWSYNMIHESCISLRREHAG